MQDGRTGSRSHCIKTKGSRVSGLLSVCDACCDACEVGLKSNHISSLTYPGGLTPTQSANVLKDYDRAGEVLLITSAGSEAISLTMANAMIIIGPVRNPEKEALVARRVHRIGQFKETHIFRVVAINFIHSLIVHVQCGKKAKTTGLSRKAQRIRNAQVLEERGLDNVS